MSIIFIFPAKKLTMNEESVKSAYVRNTNCVPCRISGSITFLLVGAYFYQYCKHVKPVYYIGIPSMLYLAMARALNFRPFNN